MPRELIDTGTDKRFVRRDGDGQFNESDDVGRSSAADQRHDAKTKSKKRRRRQGRPLTLDRHPGLDPGFTLPSTAPARGELQRGHS